jgi:transcriptional regulator with XRE-family HTH domain
MADSARDRKTMEASQQDSSDETLGSRLRQFRDERHMTLSELAAKSGISKGYISSLETGEHERRPSGRVLYSLAEALGVTMSDLMGRKLLPAATPDIPESLLEFSRQAKLSEADTTMLASIRFRGEQPKTVDRWRYIYDSIRNSEQMDVQT